MSKQKQAAASSDRASKKSLAIPLIVATRSGRGVEDEIAVSRTDLRRRNRDVHLMERLEDAKAGFRGVRFAALSKVVDKAFTGWTIKTQKQE